MKKEKAWDLQLYWKRGSGTGEHIANSSVFNFFDVWFLCILTLKGRLLFRDLDEEISNSLVTTQAENLKKLNKWHSNLVLMADNNFCDKQY